MVAENKKILMNFQEDFQSKLYEMNEKNSGHQLMLDNSKILLEVSIT